MSDPLYFNGIDADTGDYLLPPIQAEQLSQIIQGQTLDPTVSKELSNWWKHLNSQFFAIGEGNDPNDLSQSGWGILFASDCDPAIIDALRPLMDWRKSQAGDRYKEYIGPEGLRPDERKNDWLARHGAGPGPVDPTKVPYYLLLVGDPDKIPYRFQELVDVQYAVGRICFDSVEEYGYYAQSVVAAEKQQIKLARKLTFFGVNNPDDPATNLSHDQLILPMADAISTLDATGLNNWQIESVVRGQANKAALKDRIGGGSTPALLFSGSHGMRFNNGDNRQFGQQGALLCQDWAGPRQGKGPISQDAYFSGEDLTSDASLWGLVAFFFACYGAGTPAMDEFTAQAFKDQPSAIAPRSFIGRLPQKMLSHPRGGALAVVGHVERAWGYSFMWNNAGRQLEVFKSTVRRLMEGYPIGHAVEFFNERYAELATMLSTDLEDIKFGRQIDAFDLSGTWTAHNDARNYVIIGDPAVRLMVADQPPAAGAVLERPSISLGQSAALVQTIATLLTTSPDKAAAAPAAPVVVQPQGAAAAMPVPVEDKSTQIVPAGTAQTEYSILDNLKPAAASVGNSIQQLSQRLGEVLLSAVNEVATLKVSTYTNSQLTGAGDPLAGAQLRAYTELHVDGDVVQVVPTQDGIFDADLWNVHLAMVKQAQESRNELIQAAVSAVSSLTGLGGGK